MLNMGHSPLFFPLLIASQRAQGKSAKSRNKLLSQLDHAGFAYETYPISSYFKKEKKNDF